MVGCLDLQTEKNTNGAVVLTQTGLIDLILALMELEDCRQTFLRQR